MNRTATSAFVALSAIVAIPVAMDWFATPAVVAPESATVAAPARRAAPAAVTSPIASTAPAAQPPLALAPIEAYPPLAASAPAPAPTAIQRRATELPQTLELVTILPSTGTLPDPPRRISRSEALESVIASPEFQQTVSPLARLYLATFGRFPDYEGINYYTGQREEARPLAEIATEFAGSREFAQRYGALDNAAFVELIFNNVLGSSAQADVRGYWIDELDSGRMTRGDVIVDLSESGAFRERSANQVLVATAYTEVLHRTPDPEGYARWVAYLNAGHSYDGLINGLLTSR